MLCQLHHPNIVLFMGACSDGNAPSIVTEFAERGSLFDVIHQHGKELTLPRVRNLLIGAAKGILYLHSLVPPILHRDLKSGNVLVTQNWEAKICDFGLSRSASLSTMTKRIGTTRWTPPESMCMSVSVHLEC
jgi:sterile alpha motif and leucine zipper containing kinase AZK